MDDQQAARLAKTLGHPLRIAFMLALREQEKLSPSEYARAFGEEVVHVSYHVGVLARAEVIHVAGAVRRSGSATEHFYSRKEPQAGLLLELIDRLVEA